MRNPKRKNHAGFSLIELVIVVVIIGIIGAIAIPRMSRGADGAAESALVANLSVLRNAIDLYAAEHNGNYPTSATTITDQLTKMTDAAGNVDDGAAGSDYIYGPYVRQIPPLPVESEVAGAQTSRTFAAVAGTANAGWVYDASTGQVVANSTLQDAEGNAFNDPNFY